MINYGSRPADDEFEISVFGPGYGEAIAVHLGQRNWLLVDSCIDPGSNQSATHTYLKQIGVQAENVKAIVASHWHDDHVRGISELAALYPDAEFMLSSVFGNKEAAAFLAAYSESTAPKLARGAKELYSVIAKRTVVYPVHQRSTVLELKANSLDIRVSALSPVPAALTQSLVHFAQYLPKEKADSSQINHAPELHPNLEAVVLHIDFDGDAALLGADLENHETFGWCAVVSDRWCASKPPGTAYKVAHHGSYTGHHPKIWATMLTSEPVACMTPFNLGNLRLPTEEDKLRIKGYTPNGYLSSGATRSPDMDAAILKRLKDICTKVTRVNSGFGAIRLRKGVGAPTWNVELFGSACQL